MMKFIIFGIGFLLSNLLLGQSWKKIDSIQLEARDSITDFSVDDFHNMYYIRNFSELNKIDFQTRRRKTFSNQQILENLNTQNILQVTLKSGFFNLLVLDNQLNPIQDLIQFPIETNFSPTLTALVDNNYVWGYDPVMQRLVLWNYREKKAIRQSVILSEKTGDEFFSEMVYHQNKIYLIGYTKCLVFDEYANLVSVIPFQKFDQLYFVNQKFYYSAEGKIWKFDLQTKTTQLLDTPNGFDYFAINNRYLFVLTNKVVYLYEFQKHD
ncbi:hypothetical protein [Moheibacter stercoris]